MAEEQQPAATTVSKADIEKNKLNAVLCYIGILIIVPLVSEEAKKSPFVKFHINQGLALIISGIVLSVIAIIPILGWIVAFFGWIFLFVIWLMGIISAAQGQMKRLPLIGNIELVK